MANDIIVGLDIGSANIKAVVAENDDNLKIVSAEVIPSAGVRRGSVIDIEETSQIITKLVKKTEKKTDLSFKSVVLGVGGTEIKTQEAKGVIAISKANGEVGEGDIERVLEVAQSVSMPVNNEIIHAIPKEYKLDDQENIRNPLGMHGIRLEADVLMLEDSSSHLNNLIRSVERANLSVDSLIINSLASASIVLDKSQKELGVAVVDMGSETTAISVFEEGELIDVSVLPIGSGHITNDIAIGLRIPVDVAERVKLEYGNANPKEISKRENIDLSELTSDDDGLVSRFYVAEIIEARINEIFEMVNEELKKMGKAGLLPAGVVLVGGGAEMLNISDLAKNKLELPVRLGTPINVGGVLNQVDSPLFATAVGLIAYSRENDSKKDIGLEKYSKLIAFGGNVDFSGFREKIHRWMDRFLP